MKKPLPSSKKTRRRPARTRPVTKQNANIVKTLKRLDELQPNSATAADLIRLLRSWLIDESGYDEETWPELKDALDQERRRLGAASLFND